MPELLEVDGLTVGFGTRGRVLPVVSDVSFTLSRGETLTLLGESGSGKSVTAMATMGLMVREGATVSGAIRFAGTDLVTLPERVRRRYRGPRMAMVFQDALSGLNPVRTVGSQISEMFREHTDLSRREARRRGIALMDRVRIPAAGRRYDDYPHQFSGGMRQRVMIAMAVSLEPDLLIADEPTTALDVTVQAQILALLAELRRDTGMALLLITHDLAVAHQVADRIAVMYAGRIVEAGPGRALAAAPRHPYTRGLLAAARTGPRGTTMTPIPGGPPAPLSIPGGCAFHPRCPIAIDICRTERPAPRAVSGHSIAGHRDVSGHSITGHRDVSGHSVACHRDGSGHE